MKIKEYLSIVLGVGVGILSSFLGDYTLSLNVLLSLMVVDYVLGIIGGLMLKSTKSCSGGLSSRVGYLGLMRKFTIIIFVGVGFQLDKLLNTHMIREMFIVGYSANELVSIIEHAVVIGVPIPDALVKVIDILNEQAGGDIK